MASGIEQAHVFSQQSDRTGRVRRYNFYFFFSDLRVKNGELRTSITATRKMNDENGDVETEPEKSVDVRSCRAFFEKHSRHLFVFWLSERSFCSSQFNRARARACQFEDV